MYTVEIRPARVLSYVRLSNFLTPINDYVKRGEGGGRRQGNVCFDEFCFFPFSPLRIFPRFTDYHSSGFVPTTQQYNNTRVAPPVTYNLTESLRTRASRVFICPTRIVSRITRADENGSQTQRDKSGNPRRFN